MRLRTSPKGLLVEAGSGWVSLKAALHATESADGALTAASDDVLAFLRAGAEVRARATDLLDRVADDPAVAADPQTAGVPFVPRSMRAFMLWEAHVIQSSRILVKRFFPRPARTAVAGFERATGRTFPKLKPNARFWEAPTFYVANHTMVLADGQEMWWPSHTEFLDFELELACVLRSPLVDATPEEAIRAVGGWFVLNDWSARDVQADDARRNVFGPVVKSKTFANSIGCDVVTAEAVRRLEAGDGPRSRRRSSCGARVRRRDRQHDIGAMLAYASSGERLDAGDVISTGTMPGCCGLELDRWIRPGQTVELQIDGIGTLSNPISATAGPTTAVP